MSADLYFQNVFDHVPIHVFKVAGNPGCQSLQIDPEYVMNAAEALFAPYRKLYSSKEIHWVESYAASAVTTVQSRKPTALASQPSVLAANYTEDELNEI